MENIINKNIETLKDKVEGYVMKHNVSYMEALVDFCEKNSIDPESLRPAMIPKPILEKLEAEAAEMNLLKYKHDALPI